MYDTKISLYSFYLFKVLKRVNIIFFMETLAFFSGVFLNIYIYFRGFLFFIFIQFIVFSSVLFIILYVLP